MMRSRRTALLFLVAASGCSGAGANSLARAVIDTLPGGIVRVTSGGPTAWPATKPAVLVEEIRFQGADGTPSELGEPRSLAVDDQGRVYVVDTKPAVIKVFSPDGKFIRSIGGEGEGPGEFRVGFISIQGEHLVLQDPQVARLSVFDTAGTFLRSWNSSCCYWSDIQVDLAGRVYIPSMSSGKPGDPPRGTPYVRWSLDGVAQDTVWVPYQKSEKLWTLSVSKGSNKMSMSMPVPFLPAIVSTLDPRGGILYGWNGRFEIVRSTTGADSLLVFGRDWTPDPVSDDRRSAELESMVKGATRSIDETTVRNAFNLNDIPRTLPAFESLRVDPRGRVWARRYPVADTTHTTFDLFDSTGAYLGPVTAPIRIGPYTPQAWTRNGVVAVIEDADGRPTIVRLRFEPGH